MLYVVCDPMHVKGCSNCSHTINVLLSWSKLLTETLAEVQNCSARASIAGSDEYDSISLA